MKLAKAALDVGLYTNQREAMLEFWQHRAGVPFDELLPVGRGVQQHRHLIGESILKINHSREPMAAAAPAGYRRLILAREGLNEPQDLTKDPLGQLMAYEYRLSGKWQDPKVEKLGSAVLNSGKDAAAEAARNNSPYSN